MSIHPPTASRTLARARATCPLARVRSQWILCAVRGLLPKQRGRQLHFASAPRDLDFAGYRDPSLTGSWWMEPHDWHFAVSDVYFVEIAILTTICRNADRIFEVGVGDVMTCDLDMAAYWRLADALRSGQPLL